MPLITQDDTGAVTGANGYITVQWYLDYHEEVGTVLSRDQQDEDKVAAAIIRSTRHIDLVWGRRFPGTRVAALQTTLWPRVGVVNDEVPAIPILGLPLTLKQATAELSARAVAAPLTLDTPATAGDRVVKSIREKVGPLEEETTYETGAPVTVTSIPIVGLLMSPLLATLPTGGTVYR